jgi:hypothetical protein
VKKCIVAGLLALTLVACSNVIQPTPVSTAIPTLMVTVTPTLFPLPPTETRAVQPISEWNGIPIMPGAIAGEGDEEGYVFTIKATPQQVQEYYQLELRNRGWQLFSQDASGSSLMLVFMDSASAALTVNILSKGDEVLVLLVK